MSLVLVATHIGTVVGVLPLSAILMPRGGGTSLQTTASWAATAPVGWAVACFAMAVIVFAVEAACHSFWRVESHANLVLANPTDVRGHAPQPTGSQP